MFEVKSGKVEKHKKVVIYGPEGVGKSSLANNFPKPLFIDTEGSTTELDTDRLPRPSSWQMLKQQIEWYKGQIGQYETLIIDTIDWAEALCNQQVCSSHNVTGIEDIGYGKGYIYSTEEFGRLLNILSDVIDMGSNVVLVAHSQIVKFEQPDEMGAYDRYQLKLGKGTGSRTAAIVKEWADMVLFINYKTHSVAVDDQSRRHKAQGGTRTMFTTHHPAWDAKNRQGLPEELPLDYSHIAHVFERQAPPATDPISTQPLEQTLAQPVAEPVAPVQQETQTEPSGNTGQLENEQSFEGTEKVGINHTGINGDYAPQEIASDLDPSIPQSLRDLMTQNNVSVEEIQIVVGDRGYYPMETPIVNYDPQFIDGVLVGAWNQVFSQIKEIREKTPF